MFVQGDRAVSCSAMTHDPCSLAAQISALVKTHRVQSGESTYGKVSLSQATLTGRVLDYLRSELVFRRQCEIRCALKLKHPSVAWALLCLRRWGLVDVVRDAARNPRYMQYRAKP